MLIFIICYLQRAFSKLTFSPFPAGFFVRPSINNFIILVWEKILKFI